MKKLFFILAHKLTKPLKFTVDYLSLFSENTIIIHIDKKSNIDNFNCLVKKNVYLSEDREVIKWGHISMVDTTIRGMIDSLKFDYNYFFLVSGDDIPIMSNDNMNTLLKSNPLDYIHYQDERDHIIDPYERVIFKYPSYCFKKDMSLYERLRFKLFKLNKKENREISNYLNDRSIKLFKGSQWFTLRRSTIEHIIKFLDRNKEFRVIFESSYCPDEVFFHSLLKLILKENHIFSSQGISNDALRYIDWHSGPEYPRILSLEDIKGISFNKYFFARKVSPSLIIPSTFMENYK